MKGQARNFGKDNFNLNTALLFMISLLFLWTFLLRKATYLFLFSH